MDIKSRRTITDAGKELVCGCIKDEELRAYTFKHIGEPADSFCNIISGSLKTLGEKHALLEQLRKEVSADYAETIDSYLKQLDSALDMLDNIERDHGILLTSVVCYSEEEQATDTFDGPFPAASWEVAQELMKQYAIDSPDGDWSESYWEIRLYTADDLHIHPTAQPSLTFAATKEGELVFFDDRREQRIPRPCVERVFRNESRRFCANDEPFHMPWAPGDIIKFDNRPFDHGPRFAIVIEDDYEHMFRGQAWVAGPSRTYGVSEGSLGSKTFVDGIQDVFSPSALYTAERYNGDLPNNCAFMRELSERLHNDSNYGKQWSEGSIGHDCLQPYRKPFSPEAESIRSDILEFLDSPDIKEHLKDIDYELTTPVAAFIVDRSNEKTLRQKIEGWQKIVDHMPNCAISRRCDIINVPDFHALLRDAIKWERRAVTRFKQPEGHLYFFEDRTKREYEDDTLYGPYTTYDKCYEAIWKELEDEDPTSIEMTRRPIDPDEESPIEDSLMLNAKGEIMNCRCCIDKEVEGEDPTSVFEFMWFDIPTPFHAGDIICPHGYPDDPMVLLGTQTWTAQQIKDELPPSTYRDRISKSDSLLRYHRQSGDTSDMYAYGCQVGFSPEYPFYMGELGCFLLDMEYCREPLKPEARVLYAVRAYLDGTLSLDSLVMVSNLYELKAQLKKKVDRFDAEDGWLKDRYPELFDDTITPSARSSAKRSS